ncbi:glycosyltransferase family 4 protein [Massilia sp. PAMC28688]|uniref:glycosyltransferase family 4 protein n=1 Tax=Massilia sp. PAMC28688 TaxID=2861283 RepID=UPI001C62A76A|nr:glycosyltransferase family 4 protein [Massilia sp. PAMC28688]QYF92005.1 glycosyltransferase family 4 protein [Massilia sp. PAMC28688]
MKILTFTTLYPNSETPQHGIFTKTSLGKLLESSPVSARVVAPIPWFPFQASLFGKYGAMARSVREREENGVQISHPRYPVLPKVGQRLAPQLLAMAAIPAVRKVIDSGYDFDVIDAHYFYPDGVAAIMLGRHFKKPVVIKALGSDINVFGQMPSSRRAIAWAARHAGAVTTVSGSLKQALVELGVDEHKITVLRNGVDLSLFHPGGREQARAALQLASFTLLSVGNLIEAKGHHLAIEVLAAMPDVKLIIAGHGPERSRLGKLAEKLGVHERVTFAGSVRQPQLAELYKAADALVLASRREGWANVLLEAMACGTPVVASAIPGTVEVVQEPCAGLLFPELSAASLAAALRQLRAAYPDRAATRRYAEQFSWAAPSAAQAELYQSVLAASHARAVPGAQAGGRRAA